MGGKETVIIIDLGRVFGTMSEYAAKRANQRKGYLSKSDTELLWAISHMFKVGAEKCMEIALEDEKEEAG